MTHPCFTALEEAQRHPCLAEKISPILRRAAPAVKETISPPRPAVLVGTSPMDRTTNTVLDLLFEPTQQAARFSSGTKPRAPLAAYDIDDFALFTAGGAA
ncbi:hypothetical protein ACWD0J_10420 [Streptomyces sp. NPDC003011]